MKISTLNWTGYLSIDVQAASDFSDLLDKATEFMKRNTDEQNSISLVCQQGDKVLYKVSC